MSNLFLHRTVSVFTIALSLTCSAPIFAAESAGEKSAKPNVIVIVTDDHGYADLGCMGVMADVKTPNLDALATGGVRMTAGYVSAPQCSPSRCGLITGQFQGKFGMDHNGMLESDPVLLEHFRSLNNLPKRMKAAGYVTGMSGKSHFGSNESADLVNLGFDKAFFKHSDALGSWNMDLDGKDIPPQVQKGGYYHLEMDADFACTFINRFKAQPFFFYIAFRGPHVPLDAPKKYLDRFPGPMPEERRKALGAISCIDDGVGKIMEALRKNGLEENTLIFFTSDNGAPLHQMPHEFVTDANGLKTLTTNTPKNWNGWDGSLNEPMNGEKGMVTDGGTRIPFLVSWKGTIPGGQVYKNPVSSIDIAATANAASGQKSDAMLDGVNLLPYLSGKENGTPHDALFWRWANHFAIRKGDWKFIMVGHHPYLFDLAADPEEKHDLVNKNPERVEELRSQLAKWTQTLIPPGLPDIEADKKSSPAYAYYVEGAAAPKISPKEKKSRGEGADEESGAESAKAPREAQLFQQRDKNKDGKVTLEEFLNGRTGDVVPALDKNFKRRDINGDGVWEKSEIQSN